MDDSYRRALQRHGLEDVQPLYRKLLRRLKAEDPGAYEEAVARYHDEVEPASENPDADPVAVWLEYGAWLAPKIAPGSLVVVAETGRANPSPVPPPLGPLLIHLPENRRQRGWVLAMPRDPSPAQSETAALLCE